MNKNINKIFSFFFILLLVSCADNEVVETNETEESNIGPFYAEFLACTAGPDFSQENVASMVASFNELNISESVWWVGGYVPIQGQNKYAGVNGWWEIDWESKEAAENAWKEWAADEDAMAWDESTNSIIDCDTSNILPWNYYTPGTSTMEADDWLSFTTSTFECNFNDGKTTDDLRANVQEFNKWVDSRELRPAIISIKKHFNELISNAKGLNGNKKEVEEIYEKFSDKIIKNLISVTENGKNSEALKLINKIFSND